AYSMPRPRTGAGAGPLAPWRPRRGTLRPAAAWRRATSSARVGTPPLLAPAVADVGPSNGRSTPVALTCSAPDRRWPCQARRSRQWHPGQQFRDQALAVPALGSGLIAGQHAVAQHVARHGADVVGGHEVAAGQPGMGAGTAFERDRAARARAPGDPASERRVVARRIARGQD